MSRRYIVVSGAETALRLVAPARAALRVGAGLECEIHASERGVEASHAELFVGAALGARALAPDVAVLDETGERERPVAEGETLELGAGERLRVGPLEITLTEGLPASNELRLWDRAELEARMARAGEGAVVRVTGDEALARKARGRLRPEDVMATLGEGELVIFLPGARPSDAQVLLGDLGAISLGTSVLGPEGPAAAIDAARPGAAPGATGGERARIASVDPAMAAIEKLVAQAAESDEPVLVLGETGTGKDLLVAELHRRSSRARRPLVRLSAVEIDAEGPPAAAVSRASGGTLLLDEVSALSPRSQLALTQAIERGALAGVRLIGTSNQDLEASVHDETFRKDLFFRLARFRIDLPPLRERPGDVRAFTMALLEGAGVREPPSLAVLDALERYHWPGNVRELEGVVARAAAASAGGPIQLEHLPPELGRAEAPTDLSGRVSERGPGAGPDEDGGMSLRDEMAALERRRILEALERHPTQTEAAKALGIPLRTFLNRMDALGIPRARKK